MKIAVIGAGNWGKNLVRTFHQLGVLGAIVEPAPSLREKIKAEYPGTPLFEDFTEILRAGVTDIEAVAIATPAGTHFEVAQQALKAGMDVFVEKPMTLSVKEAEELLKVANDGARILMVGHLLLYQPAIQWMKSFLREGGLGRVLSLHQERLNFGRARSVENALWSLGVHDVAVLLDLVGASPLKVDIVGQRALQPRIEDDVYLHMSFPDGIQAHLHTAWLWPEKRRTLTVIGEKGMLVFDELAQKVTLHRKTISPKLEHTDGGSEIVFQEGGEPLKRELEHFLARITDRQAPLSDGKNGLEVVKVLELASRLLEAE